MGFQPASCLGVQFGLVEFSPVVQVVEVHRVLGWVARVSGSPLTFDEQVPTAWEQAMSGWPLPVTLFGSLNVTLDKAFTATPAPPFPPTRHQ